MLIVALLVGASAAEAKTTKRSSKAKTTQSASKSSTLSVSTFLELTDKQYNTYWYKDLSTIKKALKNLGFTETGEEDGGSYEEEDGALFPMIKDCFQKGSTMVDIYISQSYGGIKYIGIIFSSSAEKNQFLKTVKAKSRGSNICTWQEGGMTFLGVYEH